MIHRLSSISTTSVWRAAVPALVGLIVSAGAAQAQRRPAPEKSRPMVPTQSRGQSIVPPEFYPPAGMCRIWIDDVPAGKQPAPTGCASAVRNRPSNGKVLFGDDPEKIKKGKKDKNNANPTDRLVDLINRRMSQ